MDKKFYDEVMKLFQVPEQFYEEAKAMIREDEIVLIHAMGSGVYTVAELSKILDDNVLSYSHPEYIKEKYNRKILNQVVMEGGEIRYTIANFYGRYPFFAQYEPYFYRSLTRASKDALNAWDLEIYDQYKGPVIEDRKRGDYSNPIEQSDYLTLEEGIEGVMNYDGVICLHPCNCKAMEDRGLKPVNTCMAMGAWVTGPNSEHDRGHGVELTKDEAVAFVKKMHKSGLMIVGEPGGFCHCDGISCYPHKLAYLHDAKSHYPRAHYNIDWHADECVSCGICTKMCNFGAFYKDSTGKVVYDASKCWECTLCASNCPKKAIHLIKKDK